MAQSNSLDNPFLAEDYVNPYETTKFVVAVEHAKLFLGVLSDAIEHVFWRSRDITPQKYNPSSLVTECLAEYDLRSDWGRSPCIQPRSAVQIYPAPSMRPHMFIAGGFVLSAMRYFYVANHADTMNLAGVWTGILKDFPTNDIDVFITNVPNEYAIFPGEPVRSIHRAMFTYRQWLMSGSYSKEVIKSVQNDPVYKAYGSKRFLEGLRIDAKSFSKTLAEGGRDYNEKFSKIASNLNGVKLEKFNFVWRWDSSTPDTILKTFDLTCCQAGYVPLTDKFIFSPELIHAIEVGEFSVTPIQRKHYNPVVTDAVRERIAKYESKGLKYVEQFTEKTL